MSETEKIEDEQAWAAARKIVNGHAWRKHGKEFPGLSREQFEEIVYETIARPSERQNLVDNRKGCWSEHDQMIVIVDPKTKDGGTAFRPAIGKKHFYRLR